MVRAWLPRLLQLVWVSKFAFAELTAKFMKADLKGNECLSLFRSPICHHNNKQTNEPACFSGHLATQHQFGYASRKRSALSQGLPCPKFSKMIFYTYNEHHCASA